MALTEQQLDILSETLQPLFQYLEKEVIADVARRIQKTLTYTRTAELQAMSMHELGFSPAKIRSEAMKLLNADKEFRKQVEENTLKYKKEVRELIKEITEKAKEAGDDIVANAGTMAWIEDMRVWQSAGKELEDNSFLYQLVESFSKQTQGELKNLTRTTGFKMMSGYESLENVYKREMDKAIIKICTGTFSREQVLKDTVHALAQSGLRSIDFESGRSMQLDTASRVALRTGCHQLAGRVSDKNIERMGENLVYVSAHWGARNTGTGHANHARWQGKVYCIKEGPDYSEEAERINQDSITELWAATGYSVDGSHENDPLGLNGYNCRHNHHPWFEGVSTLPKNKPEPKPVTYNGKTYDYYAMTQKMRSMERGVRALKREKEALSELGMDVTHVKAAISKKTNEYMKFCDLCKINPKPSLLEYECGTANLKKTKAWKRYKEAVKEKRIDFGNIKNVTFLKTTNKTVVSSENIEKIKNAISNLSQEYNIKLDYFEVGDYNKNEYATAPLFYSAVDEQGVYKSKLVINNFSPFWTDMAHQKFLLESGYFAGNTIEDFVEHELAHVMTFQGCKTISDYENLEMLIHPQYKNGVSQYSWDSKDGAETIAEAFVKKRKGKKVSKETLDLLNTYTEVWKK